MSWGFYMQTIGSRVKALRVSKRLNQQQLAKLVGVSQPAIAKIEIGATKNIKGYVLEALARSLSTTTTYILKGAESGDDHESEMIIGEMAAIFKGLNMEDKEILVRIARNMAGEKPPVSNKKESQA